MSKQFRASAPGPMLVRQLVEILQRASQDMPAMVRNANGDWVEVGTVLTGAHYVKIEAKE